MELRFLEGSFEFGKFKLSTGSHVDAGMQFKTCWLQERNQPAHGDGVS